MAPGWRAAAPPGISCSNAAAGLAAVWGPAQRQALERGFAATGRPYAATAAAQAIAALDDHAGRWSAARVDACEATHRRGEQSGQELDRRMGCLDNRLDGLGAAVGFLSASPDGAAVDGARSITASLPPIRDCDDAAIGSWDQGLRSGSAQRQASLLWSRARSANILYLTGHHREAEQIAAAALAEAERVAVPALVAALLFRLGASQERLAIPAAEQTLQRSIEKANEARDDQTAARAWAALLWSTSQRASSMIELQPLMTGARAAAVRNSDPAVLAALDHAIGAALIKLGKYDKAHDSCKRAGATWESLGLEREAIETLDCQARARRLAGRPGISPTEVAFGHGTVAMVLFRLGQHELAGRHFARAVALYDQPDNLNRDDLSYATILFHYGQSLVGRGLHGEAEPILARAAGLFRERGESNHAEAVEHWLRNHRLRGGE